MKTLPFITVLLTIGFLPAAIPPAQASTPSTTTQLETLALDRQQYPATTIDGGFDSTDNYTLAKVAKRWRKRLIFYQVGAIDRLLLLLKQS